MIEFDKIKGKVVIICGATATGKSHLALYIAQSLNGVIINSDSMQVYQGLSILTAQPSTVDYKLVEHQLYGMIECGQHFSVGKWLELVCPIIYACLQAQKTPIIVGGTGMYINALLHGLSPVPDISSRVKQKIVSLAQGLELAELHGLLLRCDPELAARVKLHDKQRIIRGLEVFEETGIPLSKWHNERSQEAGLAHLQYFKIYVKPQRSIIYQNCDDRFLEMVNKGLVEEIKSLRQKKGEISYPKALGLKEIIEYIEGVHTLEEAIKRVQQKTRQYVKRQSTWFNNQLIYDLMLPTVLGLK